jgi:hypothetical protein
MQLSTFIKQSTFKLSLVSLASLGSLTMTSTSAHAIQLVNFNSWQKFGDVTTPALGTANLSNNALLGDDGSADGDYNYSGDPAGEALPNPNLQTFLGLTDAGLDVGGIAYEGSAIKNTVTVAAGDVLRFNWNFRTNESQPGGLKDFAFFLVGNTVFKLADFTDATQPSTPYLWETGLRQYTFATAGTYSLALGIADIDDYNVSSALEISNARIEPVPEPSTIGLLTTVGFIVGMRRRFGQKNSLANRK